MPFPTRPRRRPPPRGRVATRAEGGTAQHAPRGTHVGRGGLIAAGTPVRDTLRATRALLRDVLRRRRVPLGALRETLTAAVDDELRRGGHPPRSRRAYLGHLRRFLRAFDRHRGLPGEEAIRHHLLDLRHGRSLPRRYVARRARAVAFLYARVLREDQPVRQPPFDAIEFPLGRLWPE